MSAPTSLVDVTVPAISGLTYKPDFLSHEEENALVDEMGRLTFGEVVFRGVVARRRVAQFGWDYDFASLAAWPAAPIPGFLEPIRARAAQLVGTTTELLEDALITEYRPGAAIGWHRDGPPFGIIAGISLLSPCRFRLRPKGGRRVDTVTIELEPRSIYLLAGEARSVWEHSIPPATELRYSITFRTLRRRD